MPVKSDYFFDVNGIQCNVISTSRSRGLGRYSLKDSMPFYDYANKGLIPMTSYVHTYTAQLRLKILLFKIMEALNWKYDAESELLRTYHEECLGVLLPYQDIGIFAINNAVVEKVDVAKKELVVRGKVDKLRGGVEETHVLHLGDRPRVCHRSGEAFKADGRLEDVNVGDRINVYFQLKSGTKDHKMLRNIARDPKIRPAYNLADLFWVTGEITALDTASGTCTIKMPKPDIKEGEWIGYRYWQEAMDKYGTKLPERGRTRNIYLTGKPMLEGDESARTFNLIIDSAVELSVNGLIQFDMSGMKVGDKAVLSFNMQDIRNVHPEYRPWHLMVVTKDKLTSIPGSAGKGE